MHKGGSALEDNSVGDLDIPRITVGDDARGTRDRRRWAHQAAQRQRRLFTYRVEISKPHDACGRGCRAVRQQTLRSRFPVAVGGHKAKDRTAVSTTTGMVERRGRELLTRAKRMTMVKFG